MYIIYGASCRKCNDDEPGTVLLIIKTTYMLCTNRGLVSGLPNTDGKRVINAGALARLAYSAKNISIYP